MRKIVVAEASSTIKSVADTLLRQNGFDVICTSDGLQAWEVIQSERPALVFAGLNLSGISGLELCRQVSGGQPNSGTPVILMMGAKDALTEDQLRSSGARGRLKKPFSPRDLLEAVNKVIGPDPDQPPDQGGPAVGKAKTSYKAEVVPSNTHIPTDDSNVYHLDWRDLEKLDESEGGPDGEGDSDSSDSQRLEVDEDQYNLIPEADEAVDGQDQSQPPGDDEGYEWFVGEMKKEIEGNATVKDKTARPQERKKPSHIPKKRAPASELKFEDLSPTSQASESRGRADLAVAEKAKNSRAADSLTQAEIEKIADKVVTRLAAKIAGQLDRKIIYEAIRAVLKS